METKPNPAELWMSVLTCLAAYCASIQEVISIVQDCPITDVFAFGKYGLQKVLVLHQLGLLLVSFMGSMSKDLVVSLEDLNQFCSGWQGTNVTTKPTMMDKIKSTVFSGILEKNAA